MLFVQGQYSWCKGVQTKSKITRESKGIAIDNEEKNVAYEIVELEKVIETQQINDELIQDAEKNASAAGLSIDESS